MSVDMVEKVHRLNYKALEVGDVLVEVGASKFGKVIRAVERKPFTHALICISAGQVVEAVQRGVVFLPTTRIVTREPDRFRQLRYPGLIDLQREGIEGAVRSQAFKNYNLRGALGTKAAPIRTRIKGDRFFCSELVAAAYTSIGIDLVPGTKAASLTPNKLLGGKSVLEDITSPELFDEIPIVREEDRRAVEAMLDRDENIQGTEIDENREIEQKIVKAFRSGFEARSNYLDGKRRRLRNLAEMLRGLCEMKPENAAVLSDRLTESLENEGYFEIFGRTVSKSHIPTWTTDMAILWYSDRQAEAMALIDTAYEIAILYRVTARRMRDDAGSIAPQLASRLSILKKLNDMLIRNAETLESYCEKAENFKRVKDLAFAQKTPPNDP